MIGQLTFRVSAQDHTATLDDDLQWSAAEPAIAEYLTQTFPARPDADLPNFVVGRHLLYQTAERLGGKVVIPARRRQKKKPELV